MCMCLNQICQACIQCAPCARCTNISSYRAPLVAHDDTNLLQALMFLFCLLFKSDTLPQCAVRAVCGRPTHIFGTTA